MDHTDIQWSAEFRSLGGRLPALDAGSVHIWARSVRESALRVFDLLSEDERSRAARFRRREDRERFVAARGFLRQVLAHYTASPPEALCFHQRPGGKPTLGADSEIAFSLSHSGAMVLVAITRDAAVGVDVEMIRAFNVRQVARSCFSDDELEAVVSDSEADELNAFYRQWTLKEAYFKATGEGLCGSLRGVTIRCLDEGEAWIDHGGSRDQTQASWSLRTLRPAGGYIAAVAVNAKLRAIHSGVWNVAHPPDSGPECG
jgi:4'-phosphopantetheinyl transferase